MKIALVLILTSLSGCRYEWQRAWGCNNVGLFGCKDTGGDPPNPNVPLPREAYGRPGTEVGAESEVLTNSRGERYYPGTPSYVPLIDNCIIAGGIRGECIKALPPEELRKLEAAEAERGAILREQMRAGRGHDVFGGRREVPDEC